MATEMRQPPILALEIGGTHVTAALVDVAERTVVAGSQHERSLDPHGSTSAILRTIVEAARGALGGAASGQATGASDPRDETVSATMGVAIPGPFDYAAGIGRFEGVGKFESLAGVDVGAALLEGLSPVITRARFINDADAFALGEWHAGASQGHDRAVAITIGSGIGSTFLDRGHVVEDGPLVPPMGRAYLITIDGQPLEDRVSRRAILRAAAGHPALSEPGADVRELAASARAGDARAHAIFDDALESLGRAIGPWLARFGATILVVGGAIADSWDLVGPPLVRGLRTGELPWYGPVERPRLGRQSGLIGVAIMASVSG